MGTSPLWGHFLRLKKADAHRTALHEAISSHNADQPYETTFESVGDDEVAISVNLSNQIPHQRALKIWGIMTGDVVHQLRAALDNMVFLLTERTAAPVPDRQGDPWRDVSFPIVESPQRWSRAVERSLWGIPDPALPIFRGLQPFSVSPDEPQGVPVAVLNRLWNEDKHRAIPLLDVHVELVGLEDLPKLGMEVVSAPRTNLDFAHGEVMVARLRYDATLDLRTEVYRVLDENLRFRWDVGFDPSVPQIAPEGLLMASLDRLYDTTLAALVAFEEFFPPE